MYPYTPYLFETVDLWLVECKRKPLLHLLHSPVVFRPPALPQTGFRQILDDLWSCLEGTRLGEQDSSSVVFWDGATYLGEANCSSNWFLNSIWQVRNKTYFSDLSEPSPSSSFIFCVLSRNIRREAEGLNPLNLCIEKGCLPGHIQLIYALTSGIVNLEVQVLITRVLLATSSW